MYKHTRSINDKVFEVWRSPGRFTKNPDIVQLRSGRLLLIYADVDTHWSQQNQILTLLRSDDQGKTWQKHCAVARHDINKGEERLVTPRLSYLADGRLVVLVDQDDYTHFHEEQRPGILAFWSSDGGDTWSQAQDTGIIGFEPDRIIELPDGRLATASHVLRAETQEFADVMSCSDDGGRTWYEHGTIAYDGHQRYCEGALVLLNGGKTLACALRDNLHGGYPSWAAFSSDMGKTWSKPAPMPFGGHRPYAKQLADGRTLITFRNINGGFGTYAWCGDLEKEMGYQVGGPRADAFIARLAGDTLVIENKPKTACRYTLMPPESCQSDINMEALVKVEGPAGEPVACMAIARLGVVLSIASDGISIAAGVDNRRSVDMTGFHKLTIRHQRGLLQILVDGVEVIRRAIYKQETPIGWPSISSPLSGMTQFGQTGELGSSFWKSFSYSVTNRTTDSFAWSWSADSGLWPDEYYRQRLIQIHANDPYQKASPDNGYSSWLTLPDGRILFVDYTNCGDEPGQSHIVGAYIEGKDIA